MPKKFDVKIKGKTYKIIEYLNNINTRVGSLFQLPIAGLWFSHTFNLKYSNGVWNELLISIVMASFVIFFYAYFVYLPTRLKNYFVSNYIQFAE